MNSTSTPQPTQRPRSLFHLLLGFMVLMSLGSFLQAIPLYAVIFRFFSPVLKQMMQDILQGKITSEEATEIFYTLADQVLDHSLFTIATLVGTMALAGLFIFWSLCVQKRPLSFLGMRKKKSVRHYLLGIGIGFLMFGAALGICVLSDAAEVKLTSQINWAYIGLFFFGFLLQGFEEELLLRGYLLGSIRQNSGGFQAVLISSIIFSLLHTGNQGITPLALLNLTLFGVFAGMYFLRTKSIWGVAAIHSIWNFVQGNFWGCSVSGMPLYDSIFITSLAPGRDATHGGAFGPEGGIAVTIVLVTGIFLLLWTALPSSKRQK